MDKITKWIIVCAVVLVAAAGFYFYSGPSDNTKSEIEGYCGEMSVSEALQIAEAYCSNGALKGNYQCNNYTNTLWIDFEPNEKNPMCSPACVVDVVNKSAEINWRCTGLIQPEN
ncbi:MAG: hypothetical protein MUF61_00645 [archaeon]|nr:hypothetical protein [archaeon]